MAYNHTQYEHIMAKDQAVDGTTGDLASWAPGLVPHILRGISFSSIAAITGTGGLLFEKRTAGAATGTPIDTLLLTSGNVTAGGKVVYKDQLNTKISPGEEITVVLDDSATTGDGHIIIEVEPVAENIANNTNATETA